jgi:hypothetical protein
MNRRRFVAAVALVLVLAAADRRGVVGRVGVDLLDGDRPVRVAGVSRDLSVTAPKPRADRWVDAERRLHRADHGIAAGGSERGPLVRLVTVIAGSVARAGTAAGVHLASPRAPPGAARHTH